MNQRIKKWTQKGGCPHCQKQSKNIKKQTVHEIEKNGLTKVTCKECRRTKTIENGRTSCITTWMERSGEKEDLENIFDIPFDPSKRKKPQIEFTDFKSIIEVSEEDWNKALEQMKKCFPNEDPRKKLKEYVNKKMQETWIENSKARQFYSVKKYCENCGKWYSSDENDFDHLCPKCKIKKR